MTNIFSVAHAAKGPGPDDLIKEHHLIILCLLDSHGKSLYILV